MTAPASAAATALERSCGITAVAFGETRRAGARLVTGARRRFGLDATLTVVHVPYPIAPDWTRRTVTCAVALQCSPSKERIAGYRLGELPARELRALVYVEAGVALGWIASRWPGLLSEFRRALPELEPEAEDMAAATMFDRAIALAGSDRPLDPPPLLGALPLSAAGPGGALERLRRTRGRLPWTSGSRRRRPRPRPWSVPVGGDGGAPNRNPPPPSRPDDNDPDLTPEHRPGIPYPEWNMWTQSFRRDHVAVVERADAARIPEQTSAASDLRHWFEQHTHRAMTGRLEDGADLDVDRYVGHYIDALTGAAAQPRVFRDLARADRDVTTAVLLDGSSSLGMRGGEAFRLELACADALSSAMTRARERHGVFVFTGNTRHRVEVRCLKNFTDRRFVPPSAQGLVTGGYTRLGAPLRHLTARLLAQPAQRRLLLVIGDGLLSDEGYEGRYAWADAAHAVEEADRAGVRIYYLGVGPVRVDPLPEVFGPRRSRRIRRVDELPRVLARVHRELTAP
ncbi:nitric oxide reductase activation protein NorD [Nocardia sp. alder85J]|uniref:nitric oxide reductase activation protein NorD n=1 Tax=Nocardia sp. alder85J TaxID=2862949 RepID=UPI001CD56DB6|nr:MorD protein [Nocardia sp. alder85J]MCX4091946.1 MorD protein [Nocardia sp. alder85J]